MTVSVWLAKGKRGARGMVPPTLLDDGFYRVATAASRDWTKGRYLAFTYS